MCIPPILSLYLVFSFYFHPLTTILTLSKTNPSMLFQIKHIKCIWRPCRCCPARATCELAELTSDTLILNVDESVSLNPCKAGFGGFVRNHFGEFKFGFYGCLGEASVLCAELHTIRTGLQLCWQAGSSGNAAIPHFC